MYAYSFPKINKYESSYFSFVSLPVLSFRNAKLIKYPLHVAMIIMTYIFFKLTTELTRKHDHYNLDIL